MKESTLSVLLPVRDHADQLAHTVMECLAVVPRHFSDFEIIIIDDGSSDASPTIADSLAVTYDPVMVIHHRRQRGYGSALRSGMAAARGDYILCIEPGGSLSITALDRLIDHLPEHDLITGYNRSWADNIGPYTRALTQLTNLLFGLDLRDIGTHMAIFRSDLVHRLPLISSGAITMVELYARAGHAGLSRVHIGLDEADRMRRDAVEQHLSPGELLWLWLRFGKPQAPVELDQAPWHQRALLAMALAVIVVGLWLLRRRQPSHT